MAKNKKSVLLYCDIIHTVEKLSDEQAGVLFKHYLRYVNDQDPKIDDLLVEIAFEPIKQNLKRDLKKWEEEKGERSNSGKLGNLKRWHKDLYDKVLAKKITIKEAEVIANGRKVSLCDNSIANIAVNDTVNVNVTDTVNDINKQQCESEPEKENLDGRKKYGEFVRLSFLEELTLKAKCSGKDFQEIIDELNIAIGRASSEEVKRRFSNHYFAFLAFLNQRSRNDSTFAKKELKPIKKSKERVKLEKWLEGFDDISNAETYATSIFKKYSEEIISRVMKDSMCVSVFKFYELADFYVKKEKND